LDVSLIRTFKERGQTPGRHLYGLILRQGMAPVVAGLLAAAVAFGPRP